MSLSESARREIVRELESNYWSLVNMRAERSRLQAEIEAIKTRLTAFDVLIRSYEGTTNV